MMRILSSISGLTEFTNRLDEVVDAKVLASDFSEEIARDFTEMITAEPKYLPPSTIDRTTPYWVRNVGRIVSKNGMIDPPSLNFTNNPNSWRIAYPIKTKLLSVVRITNNIPYSMWVVSDIFQTDYASQYGWLTISETIGKIKSSGFIEKAKSSILSTVRKFIK